MSLRRSARPEIDPVAGWHLAGRPFTVTTPDGTDLQGLDAGRTGSGEQPTAVLVHCWTGERQNWDAVAVRLVQSGWRVITFDHRGHGHSDRGPVAPTIELLSDDLSLVLDHLGVDKAVVAGHSQGGAVSLQRVQAGDPRLVALTLVATSANFAARPLKPISGPVVRLVGSRVAERVIHGRAGRLIARGTVGKKPTRTAIDRTLGSLRRTDREVVREHFAAIVQADLRPGLGGVAVPTTVVVGTRDTLTPQRHARRLAKGIPGAVLQRLPGCGHMIPFERPAELAAHIVATAGRAGLHSPSPDLTTGSDEEASA